MFTPFFSDSGCLKKAEELEPGFYSKNLVLLAKTLIALKKDTELAKESLKKVLTTFEESTKWDDVEVRLVNDHLS